MIIEALKLRCPYCKRSHQVDLASLPTFSDGSKTIACGPPCGMTIATIRPDGSFLNTTPSDSERQAACDFEIVVNAPAGGGGIACPRCGETRFEPRAYPNMAGVECVTCGYFIGGGGGAPGSESGPATGSNGQGFAARGGGAGTMIHVATGKGGAGGLDPVWEAFLNGTGPDPRQLIYVRGLPHMCEVSSIKDASEVLDHFGITGEARSIADLSIHFLFTNHAFRSITLAPEP